MGIELIIEELKEDKESLRKLAKTYEKEKVNNYSSFKIYEALDDKENMQKIAKKEFVESTSINDFYLNKLNIEPTKEMYEERGNHFLKSAKKNTRSFFYPGIDSSSYEIALEAFKESNNQEKVDYIINKISKHSNKVNSKSYKNFKPILNVLKYIGLGTLLVGSMYLAGSAENNHNNINDQQNIKIEEVSKQYIK